MVQGLAACLAVLFLGLAAYRRYHPGAQQAGNSSLRLLERLPINQRTALILVEVDGEKMLLGINGDTIVPIQKPERRIESISLHDAIERELQTSFGEQLEEPTSFGQQGVV